MNTNAQYKYTQATAAEIQDHGFDVRDYNPDAIFWLIDYGDGRKGIVVQYEACVSAQCYNEDEIFDDVNDAAVWLGKRLN